MTIRNEKMKYSIAGAARSGLAAALLAKKIGCDAFLTELKPEKDFPETIEKLKKAGVEYEFGANTEKTYEGCDALVVSPGIPPTAPVIVEAEKRGIPMISELEFAWRQIDNPTIAVTGTNGKTTTTALIAHILNESGRKAVACGNIGAPLSEFAADLSPDEIVVAEVSSFQLERCSDFAPQVAAILNLTPDHIGYHGSYEKYKQAKFKIFSRQSEKDLLILNSEDEACLEAGGIAKSRKAYFGATRANRGIYFAGGAIYFKEERKEEVLMPIDQLALPGVHNLQNSMAAALAARYFEITNENVRDALKTFKGVDHRLEFVDTIDGVEYVNDSKATNVNAAWYALQSFKQPIVWIAGGRGDSNDYSQLDDAAGKNVKAIVCLGEESDDIFNHFCLKFRCKKAHSFEEAVFDAKELAEPGDVVLLAPACKSFDMFDSFEHRGDVFKDIVRNMK